MSSALEDLDIDRTEHAEVDLLEKYRELEVALGIIVNELERVRRHKAQLVAREREGHHGRE